MKTAENSPRNGRNPSQRRKNLKSKAKKERKLSKPRARYGFPSYQERLQPYALGHHQVAMGAGEEIATWLQGVPLNTQMILMTFPHEASYEAYGPFYWEFARMLPEIVARIQRRRFGQLVEELTQGLQEQQ